MSLVNDMLDDLEQRRNEQQSRPVDLSWLESASAPARRRSRRPLYVAGAGVAVLLLAGGLWWYQAMPIQPQPQQPAIKLIEEAAPITSARKSLLTAMTWSQDQNVVHLQLAFSELKPYSVERNESGLALRFYSVDTNLNAAALKPLAPVREIAIVREGNDLLVNLSIAGDFSFSDQLPADDKKRVDILLQPIAAAVAAVAAREHSEQRSPAATKPQPETKKPQPVDVERPRPQPQLTVSQRDMQTAKRAKTLLRDGDSYGAERMLQAFVSGQPQAMRSGRLLASLWLSQQRYDSAGELLASMLQREPANIELRQLKARLLMAQGQNAEAVDWLMMVKPPVQQHQEYYELLGFAARQNAQYPLSEQVYRGLIDSDNSRGDWWVGLGIALDAQAKNTAARSAYQQALALKNTSAPLRQYAKQRLSAAN